MTIWMYVYIIQFFNYIDISVFKLHKSPLKYLSINKLITTEKKPFKTKINTIKSREKKANFHLNKNSQNILKKYNKHTLTIKLFQKTH